MALCGHIGAGKESDYPYVEAGEGHWTSVRMPSPEVMELVALKFKREVRHGEIDPNTVEEKDKFLKREFHQKPSCRRVGTKGN